MVSGTISLRCSRCFSPFPHGTGSLSVSREYLALADGPAGFAQGFTCPALLRVPLRFREASRTGLSPSAGALSSAFRSPRGRDDAALQPPSGRDRAGLGWSPFARRYLGNHSCFLFLRVLRCFSSPRWPPGLAGMAGLPPAGLSHSETRGSKAVCASPRIFAAYRVLRRLREPRHPPCALICLPSRPRGSPRGGVCRKPRRLRRARSWRAALAHRSPPLFQGGSVLLRDGASPRRFPRPFAFARAGRHARLLSLQCPPRPLGCSTVQYAKYLLPEYGLCGE